MKQPWSDLPNAQYIDWVLNSLKENPKLWHEALDATSDAARDKAWMTALAAGDMARDKAWDAAWDAARTAAPRHRADGRTRVAASSAILALVAYDDCDQYLAMSFEKLKMYAILTEKPQAVLLQPMIYAREKSYQNALNYNCII